MKIYISVYHLILIQYNNNIDVHIKNNLYRKFVVYLTNIFKIIYLQILKKNYLNFFRTTKDFILVYSRSPITISFYILTSFK